MSREQRHTLRSEVSRGQDSAVLDTGGDTVSYEYNSVDSDGLKTGQVSKVSYETDQNDVTYTYNDLGQPLTIADSMGTISYPTFLTAKTKRGFKKGKY